MFCCSNESREMHKNDADAWCIKTSYLRLNFDESLLKKPLPLSLDALDDALPELHDGTAAEAAALSLTAGVLGGGPLYVAVPRCLSLCPPWYVRLSLAFLGNGLVELGPG